MNLQEALSLTYEDIKEEMVEDFLILMEDTLPSIRTYPKLVDRFRAAIYLLSLKQSGKSNMLFALEVLKEIPKTE